MKIYSHMVCGNISSGSGFLLLACQLRQWPGQFREKLATGKPWYLLYLPYHSCFIAVRSETISLSRIGIFSNPLLLAAVIFTLCLQLMVIYVPALNSIFHTQPLPLFDLAVCLGISSLVLVAVEIEKWFVRRGLLYRN